MNYLLIDGNNLAARCHHAQNDLCTVDGTKTGAIFGALRGISWVRNTLKIPLYAVVVVWDGGHSDERKRLYPEYKADRKLNTPKTPEQEADTQAYKWQLSKLRDLLGFTEIKQLHVAGVEADDLISIFACLLVQDGHHVTVFSGDTDMHQLADVVRIFDPKKELLSDGDILHRWKLADVRDILLKKAIWGDSSDNIKGVPGVGDKRASIVSCYLEAQQFKMVQKAAVPEGKDLKLVNKVMDHKKIVERNLKLMRLPRHWEESFCTLEQAEQALVQFLQVSQGDLQAFISELRSLEMDSILETMGRW